MRPSELGQWAAMWAVDPWGEDRADLRSGMVASVIANVHRDTKKRANAFRPDEFMPYRIADEQARANNLSARLRAAMTAVGKMNRKD